MKPPPGDLSAVSRETILAQLGKILASAVFQGAERSTKLLRYLVEHTANGHTNGLKEYTLGSEVLGKGSSFDPRTDTIVRAEASRLRNRLERYYAAEGQTDPLVITLPKGSYVPQFQTQPASADAAIARGKGPRSLPERVIWFALGIGLAACLFVLVAWSALRAPEPGAAVSIAVLPFANMSGDPSQDFFSDGITEEITTALAKIPDLRVVGRTSALQFKGQSHDLRAIGKALSATHLIEGSVRKEGARLRITAQLIEANTGVHVWTESYDRELIGVFAIQEGIAQAIAAALHVPLGLQPGGSLIANRTDDLNSYEQYLRARALYRAYALDEAIRVLEPVVMRDRGFAPAWGLLAEVYAGRERADDKNYYFDKAEKAAREAIRLEPRNALAYAALANVDSLRGRWTAGEDAFRRALALDPGDPDILNRYSARLGVSGRIKEALSLRAKLTAIEPFVPRYNVGTARIMVNAGQTNAAIAILEKTVAEVAPTIVNRNVALSHAYAMEGRYGEAADTLLAMLPQNVCCHRAVEDAARILRSAPRKTESPQALPALEAFVGQLNFVYVYVGALDRVLDNPERTVALHAQQLDALWAPLAAPLRKTERFKTYVRKIGLADYWRARGWPDLCRPVDADDFVCD